MYVRSDRTLEPTNAALPFSGIGAWRQIDFVRGPVGLTSLPNELAVGDL
jgi:hypothetical protein